MFIIWDDSVALGHELIDRDHQHLIAIINRLHDATLREHGPEVIGATLADLADYAHFHFEREERLMERHHYAEYADHRTRHEVLLADLTALIYRSTASSAAIRG